MNNKKFIFFDIDGTLLNDEKMPLDSTVQALRQLQKNGHEIAIATGRNLFLAREVIDTFQLDNYIVCNGAAGYFKHELKYENKLDLTAFEKLLQVSDESGHQVVYESAHALARRHESIENNANEAMRSIEFEVPDHDVSFYQNNPLYQALLFYKEEEKAIYEDGTFPEFRFVRWHDAGVDVLPNPGSKAQTALWMAKHLGFAHEDTIAFGDGNNDYELISSVGYGVAMGNAVAPVKDVAKFVTKDCNSGGIAYALEKLGLI